MDWNAKKEWGMPFLESESLIHGQRMCRNSAGNPKIPCSSADRITKKLIYGKQGKSDTDLRMGGNAESFKRFRQTSKTWKSTKGKEI